MLHRITIDGAPRDLDIRAMDEDFIAYRKMYVPPLTRENVGMILPHDDAPVMRHFKRRRYQQVIEEFFRRQIRAVGSCAVLAWEGDGVVGKMHFTTREMFAAFRRAGAWYCVDHESTPTTILSLDEDEEARLLASESRTLFVVCFNIGHMDARYHGQGIASAMLEYLKAWARERGWRRIETHSCPDITPHRSIGSWMLRRSALERRGFRVAEETRVPPHEAAARLRHIEATMAGTATFHPWEAWWVENFDCLLAASPSWRDEYDRDYVMACDL